MDRETNIDSIHAVEEQIRECERTIIKFKRARNSLLNVSKLPPEILGEVFRWNVIRKGDFGGLDKGSHNFLVVCHRWFEVASQTPELWSFWGNNLKDWARWYHHSRTAPLDLVLNRGRFSTSNDGEGDLDHDLRGALNDRATEDTIRCIHLKAGGPTFIDDIVTELTPKGEGLRSNGVESLVLCHLDSTSPVDVSDFFARYCFPKLQRLELTNCTISSWDHLTSRTSILTALKLDFTDPSYIPTSTPTTSQLFSILVSNPILQRVALLGHAISNDGCGESSSRVRLRHLRELRLGGKLERVFKLLNRLDHSRNMDRLALTLHGCDIMDISRTIGPYIRDHLQRRDRPQDGLNLLVSHEDACCRPHVIFHAGNARRIDFAAPSEADINTFVRVDIVLRREPCRDVLEGVIHDLTTYAPPGEVVHLRVYDVAARVDTYTQFPNLRALSFDNISLPAAFPNPNLVGERNIFPALEHIFLEDMDMEVEDWSPVVTFLAHRVSSGNRLDTLVIARHPDMCPEVVESIRGMVRELRIED